VIIVTVLAYVSTFVTVAAPSVRLGRLIFLGFVGAMLLNVFVPHVAATIFLRQYTPGLATGLALVLPINLTILVNAIASKELSWWELVLSTVVVAGVLLMLLPLFFRLGRLLIKGGLEGRPG